MSESFRLISVGYGELCERALWARYGLRNILHGPGVHTPSVDSASPVRVRGNSSGLGRLSVQVTIQLIFELCNAILNSGHLKHGRVGGRLETSAQEFKKIKKLTCSSLLPNIFPTGFVGTQGDLASTPPG